MDNDNFKVTLYIDYNEYGMFDNCELCMLLIKWYVKKMH